LSLQNKTLDCFVQSGVFVFVKLQLQSMHESSHLKESHHHPIRVSGAGANEHAFANPTEDWR
jgi:hypothetical protein